MINELCKAVYDGKVASHMGRRRTNYALHYFCLWFKMYSDVALWIKSCQKCQQRKHAQPAPRARMNA